MFGEIEAIDSGAEKYEERREEVQRRTGRQRDTKMTENGCEDVERDQLNGSYSEPEDATPKTLSSARRPLERGRQFTAHQGAWWRVVPTVSSSRCPMESNRQFSPRQDARPPALGSARCVVGEVARSQLCKGFPRRMIARSQLRGPCRRANVTLVNRCHYENNPRS